MVAVHLDSDQGPNGKRQFEHVRAVLFDKDGTLADPENFLIQLGHQRVRSIEAKVPGIQEPLLAALGLSSDGLDPTGLMAVGSLWENQVAAAAYVAQMGRGWQEAMALVQVSFTEAARLWPRKADHTPLFEDALPCLQRFQRAGLRLGLASADTPENLLDFADRYSLSPYFASILGSSPTIRKPGPEFLAQACAELKVDTSELLVVGDAATDLDLARQQPTAGCIIVNRVGNSAIQSLAADAIVTTLAALWPIEVPLSLPRKTR